MEVRFASVGSLPERIRTLEFYRAPLEDRLRQINGEHSTFLPNDEAGDQQIAHLEYLYKLVELFDLLNIDSNLIHLDEIDDRQHSSLQHLYEILVKGKKFGRSSEETGVLLVQVGRWRRMILSISGQNGDSWRCIGPLSPEGGHFVKRGRKEGCGAEYVSVIAYEAIKREHFALILNLGLEEIASAHEVIADNPDTFSSANNMVLRLIQAAYMAAERSVELLDGAMRPIDREGQEAHHLVNRWQIR